MKVSELIGGASESLNEGNEYSKYGAGAKRNSTGYHKKLREKFKIKGGKIIVNRFETWRQLVKNAYSSEGKLAQQVANDNNTSFAFVGQKTIGSFNESGEVNSGWVIDPKGREDGVYDPYEDGADINA